MTDKTKNLNAPALQAVAYVPITDTEIEPKKPGSSQLLTKLRDNPLAIAEGDPGAPKIQNEAFLDEAIKTIKFNQTIISTVTQLVLPGSNYLLPKGVYMCVGQDGDTGGGMMLQLFIAGSWRGGNINDNPASSNIGGLVISDGTNVRVFNTSTGTSLNFYALMF